MDSMCVEMMTQRQHDVDQTRGVGLWTKLDAGPVVVTCRVQLVTRLAEATVMSSTPAADDDGEALHVVSRTRR